MLVPRAMCDNVSSRSADGSKVSVKPRLSPESVKDPEGAASLLLEVPRSEGIGRMLVPSGRMVPVPCKERSALWRGLPANVMLGLTGELPMSEGIGSMLVPKIASPSPRRGCPVLSVEATADVSCGLAGKLPISDGMGSILVPRAPTDPILDAGLLGDSNVFSDAFDERAPPVLGLPDLFQAGISYQSPDARIAIISPFFPRIGTVSCSQFAW